MERRREFFSVRTAASDFFGGEVAEWTLRGWIKTGRLPAQKAGSRVLIRREDLEALLRPRPVAVPARQEAR